MKRQSSIPLVIALSALVCWLGYIVHQQPKVWCGREWAGICLLKGGYRSWTARFCDGLAPVDGKWQPVVITTNEYRKGYYAFPKFSHADLRGLVMTNSDVRFIK